MENLLCWVDLCGHWRITSVICFEKLFSSIFCVIIHLHHEATSDYFFIIWVNLLLLTVVTSSINTSGSVPLAAIHDHAVSSMFDRSCGILWILVCFFSSPYFPHHSGFISPKIFFQNRAGCFRCFQENLNLSFLFLNINQCFLPCCKLCLRSWRHLMIAYLHLSWLHDSDIPTTLGVFLTRLRCCGIVFLKNENNFVIMHFYYLLLCFRPFGDGGLSSAINTPTVFA